MKKGRNDTMKIVCISDTHNKHDQIDMSDIEADMLIHAGDATVMGDISEVSAFSKWWNDLPFKHKIFVPGNHDFLFQNRRDLACSMLHGTHVLIDNTISIDGLVIHGTPIVPIFGSWAFMRSRDVRQRHYEAIPDRTNILVTHGPALGRMDLNKGGERLGCEGLLDRVLMLHRLKAHICGHIHSGYGIMNKRGVSIVNAAQLDNAYKVVNKPIIFDVTL